MTQVNAMMVKLSTCSQGNLTSSWRRTTKIKISHQTGTIARMLINLIIQTILVLDVVNRVTSSLDVQAMWAKRKRGYKKHEKKGKSRRAYNDDSSSSSSSKEDEEVNLCLMAKEESISSSVTSSTSINFENYSQLLDPFKETHKEDTTVALLNNQSKGLNNLLENRVKTLEE